MSRERERGREGEVEGGWKNQADVCECVCCVVCVYVSLCVSVCVCVRVCEMKRESTVNRAYMPRDLFGRCGD